MLNNMKRAQMVDAVLGNHELADPADAWLVDLAEKSAAHYLVTGDKKAGILGKMVIGKTQIVTAATFCAKVL